VAPRVNLLPAAITERRLVRRQRAWLGAGCGVLLTLLGLLYLYQVGQAGQARQAAAREQTVTAGLQAQKTQLQPWADLQAEVTALEQLQASVYAKEIRFSGILQDVSTLMPDNAWLIQMNVALSSASPGGSGAAAQAGQPAGPAPVPGAPGTGSPVASITFSGMALGHLDVGQLVHALDGTVKRNGQPVYLNPFFTTSQQQEQSGGQQTVTFAATVDIGAAVYSGRFQRPSQAGGR